MLQSATIARVNVLGVGVSAINRAKAVELVLDALETKRRGYVCVTGVHGVMESRRDPELRRIHNAAFLCTPDGMPMVWMGRLQGFAPMGRVYGPDLMLDICAATAPRGIRHFLFGGTGGITDRLRERLTTRFPGLLIVGAYEPPFRRLNDAEQADLRRQVRDARADVLWVGLSTPKQERFMAEYLPKLEVTLMFGVGAAFDFHAGRVKQAPVWMQRSGLEWFYRLTREPRRLWRRYLSNNPRFVLLALAQWLRLRAFPLD